MMGPITPGHSGGPLSTEAKGRRVVSDGQVQIA